MKNGCGYIYSWGLMTGGVLGKSGENEEFSSTPLKINDMQFSNVSCGAFHIAALSHDGKLYTWGRSASGRLGQYIKADCVEQPLLIKGDITFELVSCGAHHTLALTDSGYIYSFGTSFSGQCGLGTRTDVYEPTLVEFSHTSEKDLKFQSIAGGYHHSLALDEEGNIWAWGTGQRGQLGLGTDIIYQLKPKMIDSKETEKIYFKFIAAGDLNSLAITLNGDIMIWGNNENGQLCSGKVTKVKSAVYYPTYIHNPDKITFKYACLGVNHGLALSDQKELYYWGRSISDISTINTHLSKIKCPIENTHYVSVSSSPYHILALTDRGNIVVWGANAYGQMCRSHTNTVVEPTVLHVIHKVTKVACGDYFSTIITQSTEINPNSNQETEDESEFTAHELTPSTSPRGSSHKKLSESNSRNLTPVRTRKATNRLSVQKANSSKSPKRKNKSSADSPKMTEKVNYKEIALPPLPISSITASRTPKKRSLQSPRSSLSKMSYSDFTDIEEISMPLSEKYFTESKGRSHYRPLSARPRPSLRFDGPPAFDVEKESKANTGNLTLHQIKTQLEELAKEEESILKEEEKLRMCKITIAEKRRTLLNELIHILQ